MTQRMTSAFISGTSSLEKVRPAYSSSAISHLAGLVVMDGQHRQVPPSPCLDVRDMAGESMGGTCWA